MAGPGFSISIPVGWTVRKTDTSLAASQGKDQVSVTRYPLLKAYDASKFAAAAAELDRAADKLAAQGKGTVTRRQTTTVAGRKIRAYRLVVDGTPTRIGFVLVGKLEFELRCAGALGAPCDLLFSSFSLA